MLTSYDNNTGLNVLGGNGENMFIQCGSKGQVPLTRNKC